MDRNLALEVVRVTETAAIASARLMGRGDHKGPTRPPSTPCEAFDSWPSAARW